MVIYILNVHRHLSETLEVAPLNMPISPILQKNVKINIILNSEKFKYFIQGYSIAYFKMLYAYKSFYI